MNILSGQKKEKKKDQKKFKFGFLIFEWFSFPKQIFFSAEV